MEKTMQDSKKEFFHKWDNTTDFEQGHTFNSYKDASKVWEYIASEISKAREEVLIELQEEFSEFGVPDDVRYSQPLFYINGIIESKLSKLNK